ELKECKEAFDLLLKAAFDGKDFQERLIKRIQILESDNLHLSEELEDALDELNELQTFMATFAGKLESKNAKLDQLKSLLELERAKTIEALDGVEPSSDFLKDDIAHLQQQI